MATEPGISVKRGQLRLYLGYAPGVGTTFALLSEGLRRAERGADVVVACARTRDRGHPAALLARHEVIPLAKVAYRGVVAEKITRAPQGQTIPDPVVRDADEIELVDITPEALRDRMARGQIYPPEQAEAALADWLRIGNLSVLTFAHAESATQLVAQSGAPGWPSCAREPRSDRG